MLPYDFCNVNNSLILLKRAMYAYCPIKNNKPKLVCIILTLHICIILMGIVFKGKVFIDH